MMDLAAQKRACGVGFEPMLDDPSRVLLVVDVDHSFQLLELRETLELDRNLHAAFRVAWIAARARGLAPPTPRPVRAAEVTS